MNQWLFVLLGLGVYALFQRSVLSLLTAPLGFVVAVLDQLHTWMVAAGRALKALISRLLADIGLAGEFRVTFALTAALSVLALILFAGAEAVTIALAWQGLGFGNSGLAQVLPLSRIEQVLTGSILGAGLWALYAYLTYGSDRSHLVVLAWHSPASRRVLRRVAATCFAMVVLVAVSLAAVRAAALVEGDRQESAVASPPPAMIDRRADPPPAMLHYERVADVARWVVSVAGSVALLLAAALAWEGAMDALSLAPTVGAALVRGCVAAARWVVAGILAFVTAMRRLVEIVLGAIAAVGNFLVRIPVEVLRRLHAWGEDVPHGRNNAGPLRAAIAIITAPGQDLQVPPTRPHNS